MAPMTAPLLTTLLTALVLSSTAVAQTAPVALDDAYMTSQDDNLSVDDPGVLDNDSDPDGDPITAVLASSGGTVGTLLLEPDGSFEYETNGFVGTESFTYKAHDGFHDSNLATVTFTVTPGNDATFYTDEALFMTALAAHGFAPQSESFEDEAAWGAARYPATQSSVTSQGITWSSPIGTSQVTTGPGPAIEGAYGFFALPHGDYLAGPQCAVPGSCTDRWRGESATPLVAIGGYVSSVNGGGKVAIYLDDDFANPIGEGFPGYGNFLGVVAPAGFSSFDFRELEGVPTDAFYIFGDKFTFARDATGTWSELGGGTPGIAGVPTLSGTGSLIGGTATTVSLSGAPPSAPMLAWVSFAPVPFAALGGTVHAFPYATQIFLFANPAGAFSGTATWPALLPPGTDVWFQFIIEDLSSIHGLTLSNGLRATTAD